MTQHFLTPKNPAIANHIEVGYNTSTKTFFARVAKVTSEEPDTVIVRAGTGHGELATPDLLVGLVQAYAHTPSLLEVALVRDQHLAMCAGCRSIKTPPDPYTYRSSDFAYRGAFSSDTTVRELLKADYEAGLKAALKQSFRW